LQLPPLSLLRFSAQGQNGQHKSIVNVQHQIIRFSTSPFFKKENNWKDAKRQQQLGFPAPQIIKATSIADFTKRVAPGFLNF